jgi:3',5'-cyclic AMP phosphodiesterase CpdA
VKKNKRCAAASPVLSEAADDREEAMALPRIWDLRHGDADDNRTSPYGAGWGSLVFSSALEFSYLKALLGFIALVVIPALLLGIAPSFIVTYGRHTLEAVASAGRDPTTFAFLSLAILIGFAVWMGRQLFVFAFDNFSHLHYTLVFPLFVTLREVLRTIAERFPGMSNTQEHLFRRRRIGTILAALLVGGAGLALAIKVEYSNGLQLVDVERVRPWAVLRAAFGNAAVVLGLSTAIASTVWLWRELTLSDPVLDWSPHLSAPTAAIVRVAHLSDLHIVGEPYGFRMETGTHGPQGNQCVRDALETLTALHKSKPVERVLVTGDITDAGTRAEWAAFMDLIANFPELRSRMSFVPGNHDTSIVDRTNTGRPDLPWSMSQALRKLRFIFSLDEIQGDRAYLVDRKSGTLGPSLSQYLREGQRPNLLRELAEHGTLRSRWELSKAWNSIFPLVEPAMNSEAYGVILLNSNAPSNFSVTNAVGVVNPPQLRALKSVLRNSAHKAWLILLHHQIVEYPVPGISLSDRVGLALMNASDVLAAISPHASRILVLHGHRHVDWIGATGNTVLCSGPSVTLGPEEYRGRFTIHEFAVGDNGAIRLTKNDRVKVTSGHPQHELEERRSHEAA